MEPTVSVIVPTFQHAAYIEQCLDGILMQRTSFPVEVLVGEDESTDGTREICQRYAEAHPDRIRLLLGSRKDVIQINGKPTGRHNLMRLMEAAKGRYIALCEGDDYWIDPLKLQKQVEVLEKDASVSLVFHNVWVKHEESRQDRFLNHGLKGDRFNAAEVFSREWFVGSASILARSEAFKGALVGFEFAVSGDMILQYHAALKGDFHYLDEVCAVYRRHDRGASNAIWGGGKHFFEAFRPTQVWLLWAISRKIQDPAILAVIRKRIRELLRMILEYKVSTVERSNAVGLEDLRAWIRERLLEVKPPVGSADALASGAALGSDIDEVALQTWSTHAVQNMRRASVAGHLRPCMQVLRDMYRKRSYSRKKLLILGVKCLAWYAKGLLVNRG